MTYTGHFRVYFNRSNAKGREWCVASVIGRYAPSIGWELALGSVCIDGVRVTTRYEPKATPDDEDGMPSAWIECEGTLTVYGGHGTITAGGV